ncbi:aspartate carbamoyltransferase catalytic subunit [Rhodanobacter sp. FW510-R12]|uniref:aspartate carbamoyltransferase catalytic subunit n=1 Tax=unclassified Rhodanobacter TaxID=2621553 RepID=UPI0007A9D223|nr:MULTISPECIES: aspartate carbamoyltransferase catalytic subunit [unclassified Rhodanobacter]KZC16772.1 aspartate carbamoyltransferase catalytic subunit [Rhodanobacter sp. FW104-R8]KZC27713.1 aspartate carbamoyltransferase catalytic subunit [Rhodanobacter sp. FW510-T8]KZC33787.1 aspartate carbamoyltransferase catalytic subunit [Rhodanobacter sp. FW510-R10]
MSPRLRHLTTLENLPRETIERLLDRAESLRDACAHGTRKLDVLAGRTVLNLFFEPSTRTRTSFELAARRLGADVVNFDIGLSSTSKGEELFDTLHTLEAMHLDAIVVRHKHSGTPEELVRHAMSGVSVINAGDGNRAHPTQGLLDALTIRQHRPDFGNLTVVICGDIKHSRVARSDIHAFTALGVKEIRLCGPAELMPAADDMPLGRRYDDFDQAIDGADAVIMLRLQKERMASIELPDEAAYFAHYGLDRRRLALAAPGCLVMHPGPINRGIEIASEVADGAQSRILEQVGNGVFVRMAVLNEVLAR